MKQEPLPPASCGAVPAAALPPSPPEPPRLTRRRPKRCLRPRPLPEGSGPGRSRRHAPRRFRALRRRSSAGRWATAPPPNPRLPCRSRPRRSRPEERPRRGGAAGSCQDMAGRGGRGLCGAAAPPPCSFSAASAKRCQLCCCWRRGETPPGTAWPDPWGPCRVPSPAVTSCPLRRPHGRQRRALGCSPRPPPALD